MNCKHEFKGHANGVTCMKCGKTMTHSEYVRSTKRKGAKNENVRKSDGVSDGAVSES